MFSVVRHGSAVAALTFSAVASPGADPFADSLVSYDPGINATPGYTTPETALGSPERFTGEGIFPGVVSVFNSPFGTDEIVSIGAGGHLTVAFDEPVTDDPDNVYGIDLLIFGNAFFTDVSGFTTGQCSDPCTVAVEGGIVEVSSDGETWFTVPDIHADALFPTQGYLDTAAFDDTPGRAPTDFTRPVDPRLDARSFHGATHDAILDLYYGSGGGVGIDISAVGMTSISFVRITNPVGSPDTPEIDAVVDASPRLAGDANLNQQVNIDDLLLVISEFGIDEPGGPPVDLNNSGAVNIDDLLLVIQNWTHK